MSRLKRFVWLAAMGCVLTAGAVRADEPVDQDVLDREYMYCVRQCMRFLVQHDGQYYSTGGYIPQWARTCRRAAGQPTLRTQKTKKIPLGIVTVRHYNRSVYGGRSISSKQTKKPLYSTLKWDLDETEKFARLKALGAPKPGQFGFITSALVRKIVDDDEMILEGIQVIDYEASKKQCEKENSIISSWASAKYRALSDEYSVRTRGVEYPSTASQTIPSDTELQNMHNEMLGWLYEGQQEVIKESAKWAGMRMRVIGVPTDTVREMHRWEADHQQLIIVRVQGNEVTAIVNQLATKSKVDQDQFAADLEKLGCSKKQFVEIFKAIKSKPVKGIFLPQRLAQLVTGSPIFEDREHLRHFKFPEKVATNNSASPAPDTASTSSTEQSAKPAEPDESAPLIINDILNRMPPDALPDSTREMDGLLAMRATRWWAENVVNKTLRAEAVFLRANYIRSSGSIDGRTVGRGYAQGTFVYGPLNPAPRKTIDLCLPVTVNGHDYRIVIYAQCNSETEKQLALLRSPKTGEPAGSHTLIGTVRRASFTSTGTIAIYLDDCQIGDQASAPRPEQKSNVENQSQRPERHRIDGEDESMLAERHRIEIENRDEQAERRRLEVESRIQELERRRIEVLHRTRR